MNTYDLVLENGKVFTDNGYFDSVAIDSGKIAKVADRIDESAKRKIDLNGKYVLPAFIDAHVHMIFTGLQKTRIDMNGAKSREEAVSLVFDANKDNGRKAIIGYGWDESKWTDRRFLSADDFNRIDRPVVLYRKDLHSAVINVKAMRISGIESGDGMVREEDLKKIEPITEPDNQERNMAMQYAFNEAIAKGVCAVRDVVGKNESMHYRSTRYPVIVREMLYSDSLYEGYGSERSEGTIKAFLDGSVGSMTAAHKGWDPENLKMGRNKFLSFSRRFWESGYPISVHAIGEIATEIAASVFSLYHGELRNSVEHFEFVDDAVLGAMDKRIVISSQPNFLQWSLP
ncbi:MAG: amidohydrolase family protein, partial [Thermoplasmata archaeon]